MKMKIVFSITLLTCLTTLVFSQANPNTMSVMIDGKEYKSEPRRIKIGQYGYITGNTTGPDKSLRFWLASVDGTDMKESGNYLIIGENDNYNKDQEFQDAWLTGKYKGIVAIKYVEETKTPRMEYHVGKSTFNGESVNVQMGADGYLDITFNATLDGSWWREKATATAFGGVGRLMGKMEDKAVTSASGYDQNIDPEGNGYKMGKETDTIKLTDGKVRLKMN
jgi:hypothetical protein